MNQKENIPQVPRDLTKLELLLDELKYIHMISIDLAAQLSGINQKCYEEETENKREGDIPPAPTGSGLFPDLFNCIADIKVAQARQQKEIATLLSRI